MLSRVQRFTQQSHTRGRVLSQRRQQHKVKAVKNYSTSPIPPFGDPKSPVVITCAITGDVPSTDRIPVPVTPEQQVASILEAHEAGASVVHLHVRDENAKCTFNPDLYKKVMDGVREKAPEMILEFSTGNYAPTVQDRALCLQHKPDMASLCPGSVNFKATRPGKDIFKQFLNTHEEIDYLAKTMMDNNIKPDVAIFDVSMLYHTNDLIRQGKLKTPVRLMFVMGGHMGLEARRPLLDFLVKESTDLLGKENFTWQTVGVGWNHDSIAKWTLDLGGHLRTGFEDSLMIRRGVFAKSNADLVRHMASLCKAIDRPVATPQQAREIIGLN
mmetsp:Transcript_12831/g.14250  ORF Transcript_12831/g.14250 Transcript_12831/m.14250 type:complete len:328 (+) Transcript_12831:14-997(+)